MEKDKVERFLEFLVVGVVMGLAEDLMAVRFATGEPITMKVVGVVLVVAVPFAVFSELIIDREDVKLSSLLPESVFRSR